MADDEATPEKPQKIRRVAIGANVIAQIALLLFLAIVVNYLGFEHYRRWDLSRDQKYALSDKTKRFLGTIKGKMRVTIFFAPEHPLGQDVQSLLTEYQYAAAGKFDVETIDPYRSRSRAQAVVDKYKIVSDESQVILDYDNRTKTVQATEMAEVEQGNPMLGESSKIAAFKGEQAITSAMIDLVEGKKNAVGYVLGHKEPPIADAPPAISPMMTAEPGGRSPLSLVKTVIENENIKFQELNLSEVPEIPADLKTIAIIGPQYDLSVREMKLLRDFWDKQGRIFLLLDPSAKTPRLLAFLNELGVKVNDDRLMALMKTGIQEVVLIRDVFGRFLPDSPITKKLAETRGIFTGGCSSLTLEPDRVRAANVRLQPLIEAQRGYWAEKDYTSTDQEKLQASAAANPGTPLTIGVSMEKGGSADERVQTNSARMVVVTNASFIQDTSITQEQQALDFTSGSINWLLSREQLIGIAPKVPKTVMFSLDEKALSNLRWLVLGLLPLIPAVLGFGVWWSRRA
jgi:hypothetical protein